MRGVAPLLLSGAAIVAAGCGSSSTASSPAAQRLQREDLVAVTRALKSAGDSVGTEAASAKTAWRLIANGLPARASTARAPVAAAASEAAKLRVPALLKEAQATSLTGPGAQLAGLFRAYAVLSKRGWTLTGAAIDQIEHGSPATARFARENVALYIESVYDGHFSLAQIGKKLTDNYR